MNYSQAKGAVLAVLETSIKEALMGISEEGFNRLVVQKHCLVDSWGRPWLIWQNTPNDHSLSRRRSKQEIWAQGPYGTVALYYENGQIVSLDGDPYPELNSAAAEICLAEEHRDSWDTRLD